MADGLIPDFSPEAYTSGQGTGYAQVFNLQGPNPFETTQNTYDKLLAIEKDRLKKTYENEEKRQEKLDGFLSSIHDYDNAWEMGKQQLGKEINTYGELISGMRAQGTPIKIDELNASKKKIADLAKANEDNQKNYAKIAAIMADPIVYTDEERQAFQDEVKAEAKKDIFNVQEYLGKWSASLATPNIAADYIKLKPEAKSADKSGYIKATSPEEAKTVVVDNVWASYPDIQKKKSLSDMIQSGLVKQETVEAAKVDGKIDFENQDLKDEIGKALFTKIEPYLELDITPKPVRSGGGGGSTPKEKTKFAAQPIEGFPQDEMRKIALGDGQGGGVEPRVFQTRYSGDKNMIPYYMEYLNAEQAKSAGGKAGWYIFGKESKEASSKEIKPGESEEVLVDEYAAKNGINPGDVDYKREGNTIKFYKLENAIAPYDLNSAAMKLYGIDSIEQVAAQQRFKKIAGRSSGSQSGELD